MKPFIKRLALVMGLLFTALICMGIVYIDTIQNYWYVNGGFVKLVVSNQTGQAIMTVDTNLFGVGFNTNNTVSSFAVQGRSPSNAINASAGVSASVSGGIRMTAGKGGDTTRPTSASGGTGGAFNFHAGTGGDAPLATTNNTGGTGGSMFLNAGNGGGTPLGVATNTTSGGSGGSFALTAGNGGQPSTPSTNTLGGAGGLLSISGGLGGTPSAGWSRIGGHGGGITYAGGNGGSGTRTNGGNGGALTYTGGAAGSTSSGGNPGNPGTVEFLGGAGGTGDTNSDGAHVFLSGGAPGSGAVPGNVVLARTSGGLSRGAGVQIGPLITGGSATITNVLGGALSLDFPSTAAGTVSDIPIPVTGVESNNCAVSLSVPWQSTFGNGGIFTTFNSNDAVYVRFANNNLVTAIDPVPGTFAVVVFKIR